MRKRIDTQIPPELAEEHDEFITDAVGLARGELSPERAAAVRDRMANDQLYRAVVQPIVESYDAPPTPHDELERSLRAIHQRIGRVSEPDHALADFESRVRARRRRIPKVLLRAAAVFVLLMAIPVGYWAYADLAYFTKHRTEANVTSIIDLPDGSTARLAPSSRLIHWDGMVNRVGAMHREVTLEGTADFIVRSYADAKFQVYTKHAVVVAVGTRFRVEEHHDFTRVLVDEGSVNVQPVDSNSIVSGPPVPVAAGWRVRVLGSRVVAEGVPELAPNVAPNRGKGTP